MRPVKVYPDPIHPGPYLSLVGLSAMERSELVHTRLAVVQRGPALSRSGEMDAYLDNKIPTGFHIMSSMAECILMVVEYVLALSTIY